MEAIKGVWRKWWDATQAILPIYLGIHIAFILLSCLAILFQVRDFSWEHVPLSALWNAWGRWDVGHFAHLAQSGYTSAWRTAFFPLQSMLIYALLPWVHNPVIASMVISNIAFLVAMIVLYQLVKEDFDEERAERTVYYLALFPTSFFLVAGYNEALFLCLALLCFYQARRGHWWLAGLMGFLASLTRSAGIFLLIPFAWEYMYQRRFTIRSLLSPSILSMLLIPLGTALFAGYCYLRFGDALAFSHAQATWGRQLSFPWVGPGDAVRAIMKSSGFLSFQSLRNLIDLVLDMLMLGLLLLCVVGRWRFPRAYLSYILYGFVFWLFFQIVPNTDKRYALESMSRFMLELFPAFILLATLGRNRYVRQITSMSFCATLFFLLTQFLTGHWVL